MTPDVAAMFAPARQIADAVLYEGYVLYPYRASSQKNQLRWQFGVLTPRAWSEAGGSEPWFNQTELLIEPGENAAILLKLRFLQAQARTIEEAVDCRGSGFRAVSSLTVDGEELVTWDEGIEQEIDAAFDLATLLDGEQEVSFTLSEGREIETIRRGPQKSSGSLATDPYPNPSPVEPGERLASPHANIAPLSLHDGDSAYVESAEPITPLPAHRERGRGEGYSVAGRIIRQRWPVQGLLRVSAEPLEGPYGVVKLRVRVENVTPWDVQTASRDTIVRRSLIAAHTMIAGEDGAFISLLEPPEWARPAVASCDNVKTWPVLVGDAGRPDLVLSSPIILYDYPAIAPESQGDLYDATEIDEILTLRTMALTAAEKREARATDARAAAIIDRVEEMPAELMDKLHGAIRYLRETPGRTNGFDSTSSAPGSTAIPPLPSQWLTGGGITECDPILASRAPLPAHRERGWGEGFAARTPISLAFTAIPPPVRSQWETELGGESVPWWDPGADASVSPETDSVLIGAIPVARGSRVRLQPGARRTDAQDMFLLGQIATVEGVFLDVDGSTHLAVTLVDDPGADLQRLQGRFRYFAPDEVAPLEDES